MNDNYNLNQKKIYADYQNRSTAELEEISRANYKTDIIEIVTDILIERKNFAKNANVKSIDIESNNFLITQGKYKGKSKKEIDDLFLKGKISFSEYQTVSKEFVSDKKINKESTTNTTALTQEEMKDKIKNYFVEINDDKFTKIKIVDCKFKINWNRERVWISTQEVDTLIKTKIDRHLNAKINYCNRDGVDSLFIKITSVNWEGCYADIGKLKLYLILDDNKTIPLEKISDVEQFTKEDNNASLVYIESAQFSVAVADYVEIAKANKIDYSIRYGGGKLEGIFSEDEMNIIKGFYNNTFNENYEVEILYKSVTNSNLRIEDEQLLNSATGNSQINKNKILLSERKCICANCKNVVDVKGDGIFFICPYCKQKNLLPKEGNQKSKHISERKFICANCKNVVAVQGDGIFFICPHCKQKNLLPKEGNQKSKHNGVIIFSILLFAGFFVLFFFISNPKSNVKSNKSNSTESKPTKCEGYGNQGCIAEIRERARGAGEDILSEQYEGNGKFQIQFVDSRRGGAFNATFLMDCDCNPLSVSVTPLD